MNEFTSQPNEVILTIWLHGFKGGDHTFADFPTRIATVLSASYPSIKFIPMVAPPYDTRGLLTDSVDHHTEWLIKETTEKRMEYQTAGGKGKISILLLGHSMGGLVIADLMLALRKTKSPWPPVLGIIAFDTPYFGLNPAIFKNTAEKYLGYASEAQAGLAALGVGWGLMSSFNKKPTPAAAPQSSAKSTSLTAVAPPAPLEDDPKATNSSPWLIAGVAGTLALGAAAGAAYLNRDKITTQFSWATSHLSFVAELWKTEALEQRLRDVEEVIKDEKEGTKFHCFYTLLPSVGPSAPARTFIVLPQTTISSYFSPNTNSKAADSIQAHVDMFEDKSDGIYALGRETVALISGWIDGRK